MFAPGRLCCFRRIGALKPRLFGIVIGKDGEIGGRTCCFLTEFAATTEHRPEILLSFGFVPGVETRLGLINWLIQDPGNPAVAAEQEFVATLAAADPDRRRQLTLDLYKRVIDGVAELGFPLSIHLEAAYGTNKAAFDTFAELLAYWSP